MTWMQTIALMCLVCVVITWILGTMYDFEVFYPNTDRLLLPLRISAYLTCAAALFLVVALAFGLLEGSI